MVDWIIERYDGSDAARREWNEFVSKSRNATFLFDRNYMDYHADRFKDCSWMVRKAGRLLAILPANLTTDGVLRSHGGLTYGGWLMPPAHFDGNGMLEVFEKACNIWSRSGIRLVDYKTIPAFYTSRPSQEDRYALFRLGARLTECNLSSTIDLSDPGPFNKLRRRHLAKASKLPMEIKELSDPEEFMIMLASCLKERHNITPVHTVEEMRLLKQRFPHNIKIYVVVYEGRVHAGVCIYDTGRVAHAQYIATTPEGRELNLLTPLFHHLIFDTYSTRAYFDFGISNEEHGCFLNVGLLRQKSSMGGTGAVYQRYEIDL